MREFTSISIQLKGRPLMKQSISITLTLLFTSFAVLNAADEPIPPAFDTGRPRPPIEGFPVLGSGLALSGGHFRGVPLGELAGWTASLWFQPNSDQRGDLMNIVRNAKEGKAIRLTWEQGEIRLTAPFNRKPKDGSPDHWEFKTKVHDPDKWHQATITYAQASGPALFVDGKLIGVGERGWLGYATGFNHYQLGAGIAEGGRIDHYFEGRIDDFVLHERKLSEEEVGKLFRDEAVAGPVAAFNDFENVNHRDLARFTESDRDEAYLDEGRKLYELNCIACHSKDGITPPPNPLSRIFTKHKMENGGDPFSMFKTVTYGFRNMMPAPQLNPEERYKVIHYIRERMVRELATELYVPVADDYTETMPRSPDGAGEAAAQMEALAKTGYLRDYGRALISPVGGRGVGTPSRNALTIDLGNETTLAYDLGTMRSIGAWRGGFLDFSNTLHHKLRAAGLPAAAFDPLPGKGGWRWAWDGRAENETPPADSHTIWPEEQVRYRGHYPFGNEIVVSYTVQGRGVLESPRAETIGEDRIIHHRLTVEPGENALELIVFAAGKTKPVIDGAHAEMPSGKEIHIARLQSEAEDLTWRVSDGGDLVLRIPASTSPLHFNIAVTNHADSQSARHIVDLTTHTRGGPRRWTKTHTMKGKLAVSEFQGYALDSLPVPLKNAYNTWMRTSALTFFPDGRLAVSSLSGDVWIVTGIDGDLGEVTWQRFAAGLYEPLGMKVVDGVLTVGTRGRIVKLHDFNGDGEADYYEAFHNEPEPSPGWHAYSFDLEVGDDGSFYYARVGGFSDWSIPGGVVRVSRDGKTWEVVGAGLRVPNGIGRLPDGRITFGDNQGTYVPASKIAVTRRGAFHGAGKWTEREGNYDPETIVDPIVYMPQELDSSSGSQLWVEEDERFGPLSGQYFHTSFGRARTMVVMLDEFDDTLQGAVYSLPLPMESGTMRVAKNPADGQLYFSGLTGWQAGATREGSIQRLRYTGDDGLYVVAARARRGRLELTFNQPLDPAVTGNMDSWQATAWNYRWSRQYGSPHLKVTEPGVEGADTFAISAGRLTGDGRKLVVTIPELQPCHTLKLDFSVGEIQGPLYFTIHELPE